MRVYISGKIGEEVINEATRQKFARAEEMLKAKGYEVFNPCDERWQRTLKREYEGDRYVRSPWLTGTFPDLYGYCLLRDLMTLSTRDAVYFLEDCNKSPCARTEYHFAKATGKQMFFQSRHQACEYLISRMYMEKNAGMLKQKYQKSNWNDAEIDYFTDHIDEAWLPL